MRRVVALTVAALAVVIGLVSPDPRRSGRAVLRHRLGIAPKSDPPMTAAPIVNVRSGRHECSTDSWSTWGQYRPACPDPRDRLLRPLRAQRHC